MEMLLLKFARELRGVAVDRRGRKFAVCTANLAEVIPARCAEAAFGHLGDRRQVPMCLSIKFDCDAHVSFFLSCGRGIATPNGHPGWLLKPGCPLAIAGVPGEFCSPL
jgi:hypothetical protein